MRGNEMDKAVSLDRSSAIPLYYQLKQWLLEQIDRGMFAPGTQIPTELELCEQFQVSRGTVRQAAKELIAEGRLYLVRGCGTFVAVPHRQRWSLLDFVSVAEMLQRQSVQFETRVIEVSSQQADPRIATELRIEIGSPIVYIRRVRSLQGEPMVIFASYLPEKLAAPLYHIDLTNRSLYGVLEEECGARVMAVDHTLSVRLATEEEAHLLGVPPNSPVHDFEETAFDASGLPVDYSLSIFRGDKSRFFVRSVRTPAGTFQG
jgi:GntR family transcriptional regulator